MYYNIKPVNDINDCVQCFKGETFFSLNLKLLKAYDKRMYDYFVEHTMTSEEKYLFKKALPKCFLKLWETDILGESVLDVKTCKKLMKFIDKHVYKRDFDVDCLWGALEWAVDRGVDITITASYTPFK